MPAPASAKSSTHGPQPSPPQVSSPVGGPEPHPHFPTPHLPSPGPGPSQTTYLSLGREAGHGGRSTLALQPRLGLPIRAPPGYALHLNIHSLWIQHSPSPTTQGTADSSDPTPDSLHEALGSHPNPSQSHLTPTAVHTSPILVSHTPHPCSHIPHPSLTRPPPWSHTSPTQVSHVPHPSLTRSPPQSQTSPIPVHTSPNPVSLAPGSAHQCSRPPHRDLCGVATLQGWPGLMGCILGPLSAPGDRLFDATLLVLSVAEKTNRFL